MGMTIARVVEEKIRPQLQAHFGDLQLVKADDTTVTVKLMGACRGCPSAAETLENVVLMAIQQDFPHIREVQIDSTLSPEILEAARRMLRRSGNVSEAANRDAAPC